MKLTSLLSLAFMCIVLLTACNGDQPDSIAEFCDVYQTDTRELLDYLSDRAGQRSVVQLILDYYGAEEFLEIAVEYCRDIALDVVIDEFGSEYIIEYCYDYYD